MTRGEALDIASELPPNAKYSDIYNLICRIYNDFEDELQKAYKEGVKDEARSHKILND